MDYTYLMSLTYAALVGLGVVGAHSFYHLARTNAPAYARFLYPMVFTVFGITLHVTLHDIQGYPVRIDPPSGWEYVHHEENGDDIHLILRKDNTFRFFTIPWTEGSQEQLNDSQQQQSQGIRTEMFFEGDEVEEWQILNPSKFYRKE